MIIKSDDTFYKLNFLKPIISLTEGFVAGGCFKDIFTGNQLKDIDVFFADQTAWKVAVDRMAEKGHKIVYENDNVTAFKYRSMIVELVKKITGSPEEILTKFDFTVAKFAMFRESHGDPIDPEYTYHCMFADTFFEDLTNKKLVIDDQLVLPINSFERSYKYKKYGYGLCRESKIKLIEALRTADTSDIGMDLYFGVD